VAFVSTSPDTTKTREPEKRERESDVIERLDRYFREAVEHPNRKAWLDEAETAYKYRDGDQLTGTQKSELFNRGQPEVIENLCKVQIDRLLGTFKKQRTRTSFIGRNLPQDEGIANVLADLDRWVDQSTSFEFEECEVVKDDFTAGIGIVEWGIEKNALGQNQIFGRNEDPFVIFTDPFSKRYDWNESARYVIRSKWLDLEDAIANWPEQEAKLRQCVLLGAGATRYTGGSIYPGFYSLVEDFYIDSQRQRLRPVECWYKRKAKRRVVITPDGVSVDVELVGQRAVESVATKFGLEVKSELFDEMWLGIFCHNILIHHDRSPFRHNLFPFVPYYA